MKFNQFISYDDIQLKIRIGSLLFNVLCLRFDPTGRKWHSKKHCHSSYELHFIPYGKGFLYTNDAKYEIGQDTFYLTGPGCYHEQVSCPDDPMMEYCLNFEVEQLKKKYEDSFESLSPWEEEITSAVLHNTRFWFGKDEFGSIPLFEKIYHELQYRKIGCYLSVKNYISQIIINTIRICGANPSVSSGLPRKAPDESRRATLDLIFGTRYHEILSPLSVAAELGLSVRQLSRVAKLYYSMSFIEKLTSTRIENVCCLLLETDMTISEISDRTGFASAGYLCRVFKKYKGSTPNEYRNKYNVLQA